MKKLIAVLALSLLAGCSHSREAKFLVILHMPNQDASFVVHDWVLYGQNGIQFTTEEGAEITYHGTYTIVQK